MITGSMRIVLLLAVSLTAVFSEVASGAILTVSAPPEVTLNLFASSGGFSNVDVRGTTTLVDSLVNGAILTDFGSPGSPNLTLVASNSGFSEALAILFDSNSLLVTPDFQLAGLTGYAQLISPSVTDPVLLALITAGSGQYGFQFASQQDLGGGVTLLTYNLVNVQLADQTPVPEPSTYALAALGLGAIAIRMKRRSA